MAPLTVCSGPPRVRDKPRLAYLPSHLNHVFVTEKKPSVDSLIILPVCNLADIWRIHHKGLVFAQIKIEAKTN